MADQLAPQTLETLDAWGNLDALAYSLDDAYWGTVDLWDGASSVSGSATVSAAGSVTLNDVSGPFTLEQLDNFGTVDSIYYSFDSSIWATAKILKGAAAVTGTASAEARSNDVLGAASVTGSATVSANGAIIRQGAAAVSGVGSVSANGTGTFTGAASVSGSATVVGAGTTSPLLLGEASITGTATAELRGGLVVGGAAAGSGAASITCRGYVQGEEWTAVSGQASTWTTVSANSNIWTRVG